ncbi:CLUMA_CG012384, isoform A [Clunio marinus]|uniref:CLUMA_CG012384, isoform A n=1 Tax=Clunio marinus TaxID=568069 RepID=A0A1J1IFN0_9DIPT|nr:CLUMA_CG012384, isoform A [Clunio marinus]
MINHLYLPSPEIKRDEGKNILNHQKANKLKFFNFVSSFSSISGVLLNSCNKFNVRCFVICIQNKVHRLGKANVANIRRLTTFNYLHIRQLTFRVKRKKKVYLINVTERNWPVKYIYQD